MAKDHHGSDCMNLSRRSVLFQDTTTFVKAAKATVDSTHHSNIKPCAWHRDDFDPFFFKDKIPSYPIRQATHAPMLATEAKKMKVFGILRSRLNKPKVTKIMMMLKSDNVAPIRSTALSVLICSSDNMANSRSSPSGTSIAKVSYASERRRCSNINRRTRGWLELERQAEQGKGASNGNGGFAPLLGRVEQGKDG